jgi:V-type H+-transporting ATPase subunit a
MYKEVNPAVFACVSFPFLFGVMFGDMGHGLILLLGGIFLVVFNDNLKGGSLDTVLKARYLLLLMGVFAFYNGLIYNEAFAIPIDFFGSCYTK